MVKFEVFNIYFFNIIICIGIIINLSHINDYNVQAITNFVT